MSELPGPLAELATRLARLPGVVAVVLGGSRATGTHRPDSDWDLGIYYREGFEPGSVRGLGYAGRVSELGEWGPVMDAGAWLTVAGTPVDVIFRDLDRVEAWSEDARRGRFEVLTQNGYLAGAPTYVPVGELALCRPMSGQLPHPAYPEALAETAGERWRGRASVSLMFASAHAGAGDAVACVGMLALAVLCSGHARLAGRREWVLNEKRLVARAGLEDVRAAFARPGATSAELGATVARVAELLAVEPLEARA